jgi:hypothetical protein
MNRNIMIMVSTSLPFSGSFRVPVSGPGNPRIFSHFPTIPQYLEL